MKIKKGNQTECEGSLSSFQHDSYTSGCEQEKGWIREGKRKAKKRPQSPSHKSPHDNNEQRVGASSMVIAILSGNHIFCFVRFNHTKRLKLSKLVHTVALCEKLLNIFLTRSSHLRERRFEACEEQMPMEWQIRLMTSCARSFWFQPSHERIVDVSIIVNPFWGKFNEIFGYFKIIQVLHYALKIFPLLLLHSHVYRYSPKLYLLYFPTFLSLSSCYDSTNTSEDYSG